MRRQVEKERREKERLLCSATGKIEHFAHTAASNKSFCCSESSLMVTGLRTDELIQNLIKLASDKDTWSLAVHFVKYGSQPIKCFLQVPRLELKTAVWWWAHYSYWPFISKHTVYMFTSLRAFCKCLSKRYFIYLRSQRPTRGKKNQIRMNIIFTIILRHV